MRSEVASSKPDKPFHASNHCMGPSNGRAHALPPILPVDLRNENRSFRKAYSPKSMPAGPGDAPLRFLLRARERGAPGAAREVMLHQPAAAGNTRRFRSIVFGLFFTMKGRYLLHASSTARPPNSHQQSTSRGKCRGHRNACRRHCMADRAERPCARERMDSWNGNHRNVHGRQEAPLAVHANQHGCGRASCCHAIKAATQMIQHAYGNSNIPQ